MQPTEMLPVLHRIDLGVSNAYIIRGPDNVVLVDSGPAGSAPAIRAALTDLGHRPQDLGLIVLTHFHDDHAGSAAEMSRWSGAPVACGRADAPFVRGEPGPAADLTRSERELHAAVTAGGLPAAPATEVNHLLDDGNLLETSTLVQVVTVPGHTPGSIALYLPDHGALLTGDTIAEHQGSAVLGPFNVDRVEALRSLERLSQLPTQLAGFGHGEPQTRNAQQFIRRATDPFAL